MQCDLLVNSNLTHQLQRPSLQNVHDEIQKNVSLEIRHNKQLLIYYNVHINLYPCYLTECDEKIHTLCNM